MIQAELSKPQLETLQKGMCKNIMEEFRGLVRPWCEQVKINLENIKLLLDGQKDLARRVEAQERQYRELKEDYVRVLGLLYERGLEPSNVWGKIDTSQVAAIDD
jgi:hypothetical protein